MFFAIYIRTDIYKILYKIIYIPYPDKIYIHISRYIHTLLHILNISLMYENNDISQKSQ